MKNNYEELTICDDFMFSKVMADETLLKELLIRIIPDLRVKEFDLVISQRNLEIDIDSHGIRFDIYAKSKELIAIVEMQVRNQKEALFKRSRYYQSISDVDHLYKGTDYTELIDTYVIFLCDFDPFDDKMYVYTIEDYCEEIQGKVPFGRKTIFVNAKGEKGEISEGLKAFIELMHGEERKEDNFIEEIAEKLERARKNPRWRKEFMSMKLALDDARRDGRKEGRKEGREELLVSLVKEGELSIEVGAQRADMSVEEFQKLLKWFL